MSTYVEQCGDRTIETHTHSDLTQERAKAIRLANYYKAESFLIFQYSQGLYGWCLIGSPLEIHIRHGFDNPMFQCYSNICNVEYLKAPTTGHH